MKLSVITLICASAAISFSSCSTLENRRDTYFGYGEVNGPYTRMLRDGIPSTTNPDVATIEGTGGDFKSVR